MEWSDEASPIQARSLAGSGLVHAGVAAQEVPHPRRRSAYGPSSAGSYGFLIKALAEGLDLAVSKGWLSSDEARREMRSHVHVVQEDEVKQERIKELEAHVEEMEKQLLEAKAKIESTKSA